ncbi:MAG: M48 family metallopeptidase [Helicobacteraceae bacterium]|jgi:Zn-dependent protease with chaperone function|nr:M48 family metallopeptidase [Helicobacteraceae bacterium]
MRFTESQRVAKRNSRVLTAVFALGVICVVFFLWYVSIEIWRHAIINSMMGGIQTENPQSYPNVRFIQYYPFIFDPIELFTQTPAHITFIVVFATLLTIVLAVGYTNSKYKGDGSAVAKALGGRVVTRSVASAEEKRLLNVVEEIALASGVANPNLYILEQESGINAFAAGDSKERATIAVTRGALVYLTRDELQGVIAHEFSHILNEDMKLNMRAIGLIAGIAMFAEIGRILMNVFAQSVSRRRSNKSNGAIGVLAVCGAALFLIGSVGAFFASIIKAALNRQREYLADASAVQFTRLTDGIAEALKKIGGSNSAIHTQNASMFSHLCFANCASGLFDTHPPLKERIKRIDPYWNGKFITPKALIKESAPQEKPKESDAATSKKEKAIITTALALNAIDRIGETNVENLAIAEKELESIPIYLRERVSDALSARWIIYALLIDRGNRPIAERQRALIGKRVYLEEFYEIERPLLKIDRSSYVHLMFLCIPSLKTLTFDQYIHFRDMVEILIDADNQVSVFEFNLKYLVLYPLDINFNLKKAPKPFFSSIDSIAKEVSIILSAIVFDQYKDDLKAKESFDKVCETYEERLKYADNNRILTETLERAYNIVQEANEEARKKIVKMAISCVESDGVISAEESETIHALKAALRLGYM